MTDSEDKKKAQRAARLAVQRGIIKKAKECQDCGAARRALQAHHEDYDKPLDVVWLCGTCHGARHMTQNLLPTDRHKGRRN